MDEFERINCRKALETDEQRIIFDLMTKYELDDPTKSALFALCLSGLMNLQFGELILTWVDPLMHYTAEEMMKSFPPDWTHRN